MRITAVTLSLIVTSTASFGANTVDPWISDLVSRGWQWYGHNMAGSDYDPQTGYEELGAYGLNEAIKILGAFGADHKPVPKAYCAVLSGKLPKGVILSGVNDFAPDGEYRYSCRFSGTTVEIGDFYFTATALDRGAIFSYHMTVIPRYSQGNNNPDYPGGTVWGNQTIDDYNDGACQAGTISSKCRIRSTGCTLTAITMMLSATGLEFDPSEAFPITPLTTNALFKGHAFAGGNPYRPGGHNLELNSAIHTVRQIKSLNTKGKTITFDEQDIRNPTFLPPGTPPLPVNSLDALDAALLWGYPVLMKVPHRGKDDPKHPDGSVKLNDGCRSPVPGDIIRDGVADDGHFVVVTNEYYDPKSPEGWAAFAIMDPGCKAARTLDDYRDPLTNKLSIIVRGFIKDPTDLSFFTIAVSDNVRLTVTDPSGRQSGLDPATDGFVAEIPNSAAHHDSETDPDTGDVVPGVNLVTVATPTSGLYVLTIIGGIGQYTMTVFASANKADSEAQSPITITNSLDAGRPATFSLEYSTSNSVLVSLYPPPIAGDVNHDGVVSCEDVRIVAKGLGTVVGDSTYNAAADINSDGVIDVRDLAFVSQHLPSGTHCSK